MEIAEMEIECQAGQDVCYGLINILEIDINRPGQREHGFMVKIEKGKKNEGQIILFVY